MQTMRLITPEELPKPIRDTWHFEGDGGVDDDNHVDPALAPAA